MPCWKNEKCKRGDLLRPSPQESANVLDYSHNKWQSLLSSAQGTAQFPDSCGNIKALLRRIPAIPDASSVAETVEKHALSLEGYSIWNIQSTVACHLTSESKRSRPQNIRIGQLKPTLCSLSNEFLPEWTGFGGLTHIPPAGNYLCVFVLGWSYVLSTNLVELRGNENDRTYYTDTRATVLENLDKSFSDNHYILSIGNADERESRWWTAILANGCGWRATLTRLEAEYCSPWACHLKDDEFFTIQHDKLTFNLSSNINPPSSNQALSYLLKFAQVHNIFDQLLTAFMAALTIPNHIRFGAPVTLPTPRLYSHLNKQSTLKYRQKIPSTDEIPYFMSLSAIPGVISSCLFSSFWEPGIPCNLVSEWLHTPLQEIMPSLVGEKKHQIIVRMLAARSPNIAPLLLGSMITGMLHRIPEVYKSFIPPICLEAAVWSSSSQSFMDPTFHRMPNLQRSLIYKKIIPREDEFRLLYITDFESLDYGALPLSPYPPFGYVEFGDTALGVQLHVSCGHSLIYSHWVWRGQKQGEAQYFDDYGLVPSINISSLDKQGDRCYASAIHNNRSLQLIQRRLCNTAFTSPQQISNNDFNERLSETATRNLFSWTFFPDGVRLEDKEIWHHEWLDVLLSIDDNDSAVTSSSCISSAKRRSKSIILSWLQTIFIEQQV
ncbi:hypothetical protein MferCBS49748_002546 [Microsporum ferrugineum]